MKLVLSFLIVSVLFYSCSVSKELKEERKMWGFKNWENEFKDRAFCLCQLKGFANKEIEKTLVNNDKSYYNPLGYAIFDKALKFEIDKQVEKIRLDSLESVGRYPTDLTDLLQRRAILGNCLEFYRSKSLDSLAKTQKKTWKKIPDIMAEIHKVPPTY